MSEAVIYDHQIHDSLLRAATGPVKRKPDVTGVGAWFDRARELREAIAYVPRHRAPGPAV